MRYRNTYTNYHGETNITIQYLSLGVPLLIERKRIRMLQKDLRLLGEQTLSLAATTVLSCVCANTPTDKAHDKSARNNLLISLIP